MHPGDRHFAFSDISTHAFLGSPPRFPNIAFMRSSLPWEIFHSCEIYLRLLQLPHHPGHSIRDHSRFSTSPAKKSSAISLQVSLWKRASIFSVEVRGERRIYSRATRQSRLSISSHPAGVIAVAKEITANSMFDNDGKLSIIQT